MDFIHKITEIFREFPGIGPRQAKRFAYFLMRQNGAYLDNLSRIVSDIKVSTKLCTSCYRFFTNGSSVRNGSEALCSICLDKNRDSSKLMLVANDLDLESIEKSHVYKGLYFVMGGTIPILEKSPESRVRLKELKARLKKIAESKSDATNEIILSFSTTADGENTIEYLRSFIRDNSPAGSGLKVSILGRGLSTGAELEYIDQDTMKNALENRK